jgi:hypothetical protein
MAVNRIQVDEKNTKPREVAARFVAFTCFLNQAKKTSISPDEAGQLARSHWRDFLPFSRESLGEFLTSEAVPPPAKETKMRRDRAVERSKARKRHLAVAS